MPNTFTLIASSTVGAGGAADITFSSIPSTYTDLVLKVSGRSDSSPSAPWNALRVNFNGSSANLSGTAVYGDGSSASAGTNTNGEFGFATASNATATTFGNTEMYIPNYAGSANKSFSGDGVSENNATQSLLALESGLWSITSAITSIKIVLQVGNFVQHSTAHLYGIIKQ
jgi:hypothetical protein